MQTTEKSRHLYTHCPLCESVAISPIGQADCRSHPLYNPKLPEKIFWMKCNDCSHCFTNGYFTEDALKILFGKAHDYQLLTVKNMEQARAVSADMVDKVSSILGKQEGKWLDVGFGNGALLCTCAEYGFEPVGIDLRQAAIDKIKQLGIEAYCTEFIDFEQPGNFAVISMADVLEHMPYPKQVLDKAYELLTSDGILFVSCPNADSLVWKSLTEAKSNPYWCEIEHYHNFGRKRLYSLLGDCGFKPAHYSISKRYRIGMEVVAIKVPKSPNVND